MSWLVVSKFGTEEIYSEKPLRCTTGVWVKPHDEYCDENVEFSQKYKGDCVMLPCGTIEKILGYELTWENDPVEIR